MTDKVAGVEYAGLENDRLENDGRVCISRMLSLHTEQIRVF